jgi:hypothetical protein
VRMRAHVSGAVPGATRADVFWCHLYRWLQRNTNGGSFCRALHASSFGWPSFPRSPLSPRVGIVLAWLRGPRPTIWSTSSFGRASPIEYRHARDSVTLGQRVSHQPEGRAPEFSHIFAVALPIRTGMDVLSIVRRVSWAGVPYQGGKQ